MTNDHRGARYYDLAHGNPISDTDTSGWFGGVSPLHLGGAERARKKCRKLGKHQYDPSERITGNGFDIGNYEQISTAEKQHMLKELTWFIMSEGYETINEFTQPALERFGEQYWEIMVSYSAFLVKYLNGNKMMREKAEMQKRLAWEEAMRERCRNNEADSHSGE